MERTKEVAKEVCNLCCNMPEAHHTLMRQILERIAGRWSLYILYVLAISGEPLRFTSLSERIEGISEKVLTQTLRLLERDGLIDRHSCIRQVPPKVEYQLTQLGCDLVQATCPLWKWMFTRIAEFESARQNFIGTKSAMLFFVLYNLMDTLVDGAVIDCLCSG